MEQVALAVECCAQRWRRSTTRERLVLQLSKINWHRGLRGGVASSAVSSVEVYHDHGGRQRECHDVSQENGAALQERGTVAIRRMVPPQSGQMAKSVAVSGRSPLMRLSAGSQAPASRASSSR